MSQNSANKSLALFITIGAIAFATNPDEKSFKRFVESTMKAHGSSWFERTVVSQVSAMLYERKDFKFFSLVDIPEEDITYLGIFGIWARIPKTLDDMKQMINNNISW